MFKTKNSENDRKRNCKIVYECALKVHREIGPGLLERAYEFCLVHELLKTGLWIERQKPIPLIYDNTDMGICYRADLMIENKFIVELKSVEAIHGVHMAQTLTYLKLTNCKLGLLINFNVELLKHGVRRVINGTL